MPPSPTIAKALTPFDADSDSTINPTAIQTLLRSHSETSFQVNGTNTVADIPLVIVVPGLTSDSNSPYIKKITYNMAKHEWNVVVSKHRGLGGVPLTSECFYIVGKSNDLGEVVNHLHRKPPETPLYDVGTSLGANILRSKAFSGEHPDRAVPCTSTPDKSVSEFVSPTRTRPLDQFVCQSQGSSDPVSGRDIQVQIRARQATSTPAKGLDSFVSSRRVSGHAQLLVLLSGSSPAINSHGRTCASSSSPLHPLSLQIETIIAFVASEGSYIQSFEV
ncbi:hypothetical protein L1987_57752 [Smallanthus sonchifolius]|uniref:Uncharacterized protein n=1 Tax=Smallanthus sonchifolius TaxID=185202 RepID=A0ACB9DE62_9ASTR|nr:hypothetical protein L1987_57752 [Smallanthus sonchifolius]